MILKIKSIKSEKDINWVIVVEVTKKQSWFNRVLRGMSDEIYTTEFYSKFGSMWFETAGFTPVNDMKMELFLVQAIASEKAKAEYTKIKEYVR